MEGRLQTHRTRREVQRIREKARPKGLILIYGASDKPRVSPLHAVAAPWSFLGPGRRVPRKESALSSLATPQPQILGPYPCLGHVLSLEPGVWLALALGEQDLWNCRS